VIHGLVKRPLVWTVEDLERYPMTSRIGFVECGGNSAPLFSNEPLQENVQALHWLASVRNGRRDAVHAAGEAGIDPKRNG
jgi:sulfane dehydrogenase subunit SoxC